MVNPWSLMAWTALFWSEVSSWTSPMATTWSPVKSMPVLPAGLSGITFLMKMPAVVPWILSST